MIDEKRALYDYSTRVCSEINIRQRDIDKKIKSYTFYFFILLICNILLNASVYVIILSFFGACLMVHLNRPSTKEIPFITDKGLGWFNKKGNDLLKFYERQTSINLKIININFKKQNKDAKFTKRCNCFLLICIVLSMLDVIL